MSSEARHCTWYNGKLCGSQLDIGPISVKPEDEHRCVPGRAVSFSVPTVAVVRPIVEFLRGQGINGSDSQVGGFAVI